jgi:tRNA A22 N-methylase
MSSKAARFAENLRNRNVTPAEHVENIHRYEQAGVIGRLIIRKREPQVFQHYQQELRRRDFRKSQQSIEDARRFPDPDPSEVIIF